MQPCSKIARPYPVLPILGPLRDKVNKRCCSMLLSAESTSRSSSWGIAWYMVSSATDGSRVGEPYSTAAVRRSNEAALSNSCGSGINFPDGLQEELPEQKACAFPEHVH